jgi:drug/metabolite transporter (DMT)-like permease
VFKPFLLMIALCVLGAIGYALKGPAGKPFGSHYADQERQFFYSLGVGVMILVLIFLAFMFMNN